MLTLGYAFGLSAYNEFCLRTLVHLRWARRHFPPSSADISFVRTVPKFQECNSDYHKTESSVRFNIGTVGATFIPYAKAMPLNPQ